MNTSTKEAFLLFESRKSEGKILHVVIALTEGQGLGGRFSAVISRVSRNPDSVTFRTGDPDGPVEFPVNLDGALFEYFEPGVAVGPGIEQWLSFLKASLPSGGMALFAVPR